MLASCRFNSSSAGSPVSELLRPEIPREADPLDARVAVAHLQPRGEAPELTGRHVVARGKERRAGAQQLDVGVEPNLDEVARFVHCRLEPEFIAGARRPHQVIGEQAR